MIFTCLDFHAAAGRGQVSPAVMRAFRLRINHVVDSFSLRIPKKIRTRLFQKLNVTANQKAEWGSGFNAVEGIGLVDLVTPDIASIYRASQARAVKRVKHLLRVGIRIAAKHDSLFARHMDLWKHLLSTTGKEFDYDLCIARSHPSRRWRCQAVLRISPTNYHYDVLVQDSRGLETIQRQRIKTTPCALPFYTGIGFSKLRWEKQDIVGLTRDDNEVFRFEAKLPA